MNINSYYATEQLARERTDDLLRTADRHRLLRAFRIAGKANRRIRRPRTSASAVEAVAPVTSTDRLRPLDTSPDPVVQAPAADRQEQPVG